MITHPIQSKRSSRLVHNTYPGNESIYELQQIAEQHDRTLDFLQGESGTGLNFDDWDVPAGVILESAVTSGTDTTLTDTTQNWGINQWKDHIVKIYKNGGADFQFGVVLSNTANTLTFDDNLIGAPCNLCMYKIIHTYIIPPERLPFILAVDNRNGEGGVILPKVTPDIERRYVHVYMERTVGDTEVPIISRTTDRQGGVKYGVLEDRNEGVRLYTHQWQSEHWDIISTYNIKRFTTAYWLNDTNVPATNNVFHIVSPVANVTTDFYKRFRPVERDGNIWWRYTSLIPQYFYMIFTANISKTGGVGDAQITWRKRHADGTIEDLDTRSSGTRFGAGAGENTITVEVPVLLSRNDEVTPILAKTGTFVVEQGSYIKIIQF
jgi:hypothetical protein